MSLYVMTGNDVMNEALLLIKRIRVGQTAALTEIATAQLSINYLIDEWNGQGAAVAAVAPVTCPLVSGQGAYTIGPGSATTWTPAVTMRPVRIEAWNVKTSSGQANGGVPLDAAQFATLAIDRGAQGVRVKALNFDGAFPIASVHLYPLPTAGTLELWVWQQLAQIADFTIALTWPTAYIKALVFGLAVQLADKFDMPVSQNTISQAAEGRAAILTASATLRPAAAAPLVTPPAQQ